MVRVEHAVGVSREVDHIVQLQPADVLLGQRNLQMYRFSHVVPLPYICSTRPSR